MTLNKYAVSLPVFSSYEPYFSFSSQFASGIYLFNIQWFEDHWVCFVQTPYGEVRQAGVYPGVQNFAGYDDSFVTFEQALGADSIGQYDFYSGNVRLFVEAYE